MKTVKRYRSKYMKAKPSITSRSYGIVFDNRDFKQLHHRSLVP